MKYLNIAFYHFVELKNLEELRREYREACSGFQSQGELKGTILLSAEGINGMISGEEPAVRALQAFLSGKPELAQMPYKESWSSKIGFPRMLVKIKKEIIPLGLPWVQPAKSTGERLTPAEFKKWLDEKRDLFVLDTRNDYEIAMGTFDKAHDLGLKNFRDFPEKLKSLPPELKDKPMVMFCTGGIRCEKASVVALEQGFKEVYQLDGGILKYFEECGSSHYQGDCFVFDRRIALDPALNERADAVHIPKETSPA